MVIAKKVTKAPAVVVETKMISQKDACCSTKGTACGGKMKCLLVPVLLVVNTVLLGYVLCNQVNVEADRVGGRDNYKMVQQIYKSDAFKAQQKQQIQQALQQYQGGGAATQQGGAAQQLPTNTPTTTTTK